jgi:formate-dependent nitrite reductase cytochrome c552 subunit
MLPGGVEAAPPAPAGAEACVECHVEETEAWQDSVHAHAVQGKHGATCEDCHGPYVEDHPEAGLMQLTMDSSVCEDCHASTFHEWEDSIHAQNGVQCIGCHLSHSQEFRVSDDRLCASCHRDRLNTVHGSSDVSCIDCHLSSASATNVSFVSGGESGQAGESVHSIQAASHDFTGVVAKDCVGCHGEDVHQQNVSQASPLGTLECEPEIIAKLENAEQTNRSLMTITPASLGLGMGIGGMLGVITMLVIGYISQGMKKQ